MVDSHPEVAVPPETLFLLHLIARRGRYQNARGFALELFLNDVESDPHLEPWSLSPTSLVDSVRARRPSNFAGAVRSLFSAYAEQRGKQRWAYKMNHGPSVDLIARLFPEARFAHLVRDGRDAALAVMDSDFAPAHIDHAAFEWRRNVRAIRLTGSRLGPHRYLELRYEDLVTDTETTLRTLCGFAAIDYSTQMLGYAERAEETIDPVFAHRHEGLRLPPTNGRRDHAVQMEPNDIELFELHAGGLLRELGYPPSSEHIALRTRVVGSLRMSRLHAQRLRRALTRMLKKENLRWPYGDGLEERTGLPTKRPAA